MKITAIILRRTTSILHFLASGCLILCANAAIAASDPAMQPGQCDDSLSQVFAADDSTKVVLVKPFKKGDELKLSPKSMPFTPTLLSNACLVKLVVGPGKPGHPKSPNASQGIGIEILLPDVAQWNGRIRNFGGGGWAGGMHSLPFAVGTHNFQREMSALANGFAIGTTDTGHVVPMTGAFAMNDDGTINETLWHDFAFRGIHELAIKSKQVVKAYYGKPHEYAYWDGFSTGGRQGLKAAQTFPNEYDGYLIGAPAINWTRMIMAELYPHVVMQNELGNPIAPEKLNMASAAAVKHCAPDGLKFIPDPFNCDYNPETDKALLCSNEGDESELCLTRQEARVVNQIWYGPTADGRYQPPGKLLQHTSLGDEQLWWGVSVDANLTGTHADPTASHRSPLALAGPKPFAIGTDLTAILLEDAAYASDSFVNPSSKERNKWQSMNYGDLANVYRLGLAYQSKLGDINTDNPNLSGVKKHGGKILHYHGLADQVIMPEGSVNYYQQVLNEMGGLGKVSEFHKFYLIPGMGHGIHRNVGSIDPETGLAASDKDIPLPVRDGENDQLFSLLMAWVEKGDAPDRIELSSSDGSVSMPVCPYPQKAVYQGQGDVTKSDSYHCQ